MTRKSATYSGRNPPISSFRPSDDTVRKMFGIAEGFVRQAEALLLEVVEIDGKLAEALEAEVLLVTGNKAKIQPKILTPSLMFRHGALEDVSDDDDGRRAESLVLLEADKLFPQIAASRISLDFCGVLYNSLLVLKRAEAFRREPPKNKSNALFLGSLRSVLKDLTRLQVQRDALDHLISQSQSQLTVLGLQPRVMAEQLSLIDSALFAKVQVVEELQFAGWIGKERRQRAPYLTAMREFGGYVSHWVTWEVLRPELTLQQRAEVLIHFVGVGECLADLASYNVLSAVIRGLSSPAILRLGTLFDILPKRTLISWDNLQVMVLEPIKQRALISKAPATCIPAVDTAYLADLLLVEPEFLTLHAKDASNHKFVKYCESMEKFRLQSSRVYAVKHALHPALQHFLLSRPFLSSKELRAASHLVLPPSHPEVLSPARSPIKPFYRRYLDDDDRLFLPLKPPVERRTGEQVDKIEVEEEQFSLGEQPETIQKSFYPLDDIDERAARTNNIV